MDAKFIWIINRGHACRLISLPAIVMVACTRAYSGFRSTVHRARHYFWHYHHNGTASISIRLAH